MEVEKRSQGNAACWAQPSVKADPREDSPTKSFVSKINPVEAPTALSMQFEILSPKIARDFPLHVRHARKSQSMKTWIALRVTVTVFLGAISVIPMWE